MAQLATYRAMEHLLINIEEFGGKEDLAILEKFYETIKDKTDSLSEGLQTRVEWTIERLKQRAEDRGRRTEGGGKHL